MAVGRSFRLHRPRGAFCQAGWCEQCRVNLADGSIALACMNGAARGSRPPSRWKSWFGRLADRLPPWFYEHRLLRPKALRQFYLNALRRLSAAPVLPMAAAASGGEWRRRRCDLLIVGGGLAGLEAAEAAIAAGEDVLLVEAEELGGRARFQPRSRAALDRLLAALPGERLLARTLCAGLYEDGRQALLIAPDGPILLEFSRLIVATGAYDRLPGFSGNDLPGIIGLRAFERLAHANALPRDGAVGLFGHVAEIEAALATGHRFAWIASPAGEPAGAGAMQGDRTLVAANGRGRIRSVTLEPGGEFRCDLLVLGFSQASYELPAQAGRLATLGGDPPVVSMVGAARIELRAIGDAALAPARTARPACRPSPDAFLCLCEDVRRRDAATAIADGYDDIELLKRRTGAGTGPCQGKLCHAEILGMLAAAGRPVALPTMRPLTRPVLLRAFAGADHG
jgi:sarcosine oxidase, subunit alpha